MTTTKTFVVAIGVCVVLASGVLAEQPAPAAPLNPYTPPPCTGVFTDVACPGGFAVNWIEEFYNNGISAGCNAAPLQYCPDAAVTRAQMAVFVEKAMRGTSGWSPGDLGNSNTGIGADALGSSLNWGGKNTAAGASALFTQSFTNGNVPYDSSNTALGYEALYWNQPDGGNGGQNGTANTAVGTDALVSNTTGYGNAAVGVSAGQSNTSGSGNTFVGTGANPISGALSNSTAIGWNAIVDTPNKVVIGNPGVGVIGGQVPWTAFSDARGKKDIAELDLGLGFVMELRPVSYRLRDGNDRTDMGFVAQDIEALLGDGYNVLAIGGDKDRTLALRHTDLIAPMVKAIQEQQATIERQQAQIEGRDARIEALEARLAAIEARLAGE